MREVLALGVGYLLGSVLPAEIIARARGIDIRAVGTGNPGATNALKQLGPVAGTVTGAYDASVGLVAMYVAYLLGLSAGWSYLAGVAAVAGHVFPVFSRFRGGQGMAATTGLLVFEMGVALSRGWLAPTGMLALAALGLVAFSLTRSATVVGVVTAPVLVLEIALGRPDPAFLAFVTGLAGMIWLVQFGIAHERRLFRVAAPVRARLAHLRTGGRTR